MTADPASAPFPPPSAPWDASFDPLAPSPFRELALTTPDGATVAARHFTPTAPARGAVFLAPAMAVPQSFYEPMARHLADLGFHVLSFDYRGTGASRTTPLRKVDTDILRWAEVDTRLALDALVARTAGLPRTWIGHSLGGQILPLVANHQAVAKVVTIATGSGYWRENAPALRKKVWLLWYGFVPALTPLFGYFPGGRLGMVGDLPRGVIRQWRSWCLHPEYLVGVLGDTMRARYAAFDRPITSLSFTDDELMSERNITSLHGFYAGSEVRLRRIDPAQVGVRRIGHFGFFRAEHAPLWGRFLIPELATL
jgi:predicted alpha/beta hydrolase